MFDAYIFKMHASDIVNAIVYNAVMTQQYKISELDGH